MIKICVTLTDILKFCSFFEKKKISPCIPFYDDFLKTFILTHFPPLPHEHCMNMFLALRKLGFDALIFPH